MTTRRSHAALAATTLGAVVLLTGCGSSGSTAADAATTGTPTGSMSMSMAPGSSMPTSPKAAAPATITISDFAFSGTAGVPAGSTVTVTNRDSETHSVTADDAGGFDVTVPAGQSRTFPAPTVAGSYAFHCTFHSNMHGILRVG